MPLEMDKLRIFQRRKCYPKTVIERNDAPIILLYYAGFDLSRGDISHHIDMRYEAQGRHLVVNIAGQGGVHIPMFVEVSIT